MKIHETELTVRYCETDQMGIVHHSRYYPWFEVGRTEFFASGGISYGEMEQQGIMLPLLETHCRYLVPARYEDVVLIKTSVARLSPVKITFQYDAVRKKDDVLLAHGETTLVFTDTDFRPLNLKKRNPALWEYVSKMTEEETEK